MQAVWPPCRVPARQVHPIALDLPNTPKYSVGSTSLPLQWVATAAVGHSSSSEVSQVVFMSHFCRKHLLNRKKMAEAESAGEAPTPSG